MRSQQLDDENSFYLRNPREVRRRGTGRALANDDIRIDYVQHAMCAWLHLARVLRDPSYGSKAH